MSFIVVRVTSVTPHRKYPCLSFKLIVRNWDGIQHWTQQIWASFGPLVRDHWQLNRAICSVNAQKGECGTLFSSDPVASNTETEHYYERRFHLLKTQTIKVCLFWTTVPRIGYTIGTGTDIEQCANKLRNKIVMKYSQFYKNINVRERMTAISNAVFVIKTWTKKKIEYIFRIVNESKYLLSAYLQCSSQMQSIWQTYDTHTHDTLSLFHSTFFLPLQTQIQHSWIITFIELRSL